MKLTGFMALALAELTASPLARADIIGFGINGTGWTLNAGPFGGVPPVVQSDVLRLTDGTVQQHSAFFNEPQEITQFTASFSWQNFTPYDGWDPGDGMVFVLQNQGLNAVGESGSYLGFRGISPATGVAFNLFQVVGTGYAPNSVPFGYMPVTPVDLHSLHPIEVTLSYNGTTLFESLYDPVAQTSFHTSYRVNLPTDAGGSTAYVGFTGGTGSAMTDQRISNFKFTTVPEPTPTALWLLALGGLIRQSLVEARRRSRKASSQSTNDNS